MMMPKKILLRWVGWFFFVNIVLSVLIQASYLTIMPDLHEVYGSTTSSIALAYFFLSVSYIAHATIINSIMAGIIFIVAWLIPRKTLIFPLATLFSLIVLIAEVIDRFAYRLYHSHQFSVGITILKSGVVGEEMPLSLVEYTFLGLTIAGIIFIQSLIVWLVWRWVKQSSERNSYRYGYRLFALLCACVVLSYSMMAFVISVPPRYRFNDVDSHLLLKMARLVPYYQNVYTWVIPNTADDYHLWRSKSLHVLVPTGEINKTLHYPLHPMQCLPPVKKMNILFVVFDTLRYDAVTPIVMPHVFQFAQKTVQFDNAYSGGNCTQPGIFSMFYGLPANYWQSTIDQKKGPIVISQLQKSGYQLGIFTSASLLFPQFTQNVFANVHPLPGDTPGDSSMSRDKKITEFFSRFIKKRDSSKPFFSFIFYDTVHNYCENSSHENMSPFHPAIAECERFSLNADTDPQPYINRYHNAAYFLDQQAAELFKVLSDKKLLKNTIVIITADHGEQQNDQHMDYWSHASAYTPYQLHIPLFVYWPGMAPQHRSYRVDNHDIVPTLLQKVFNCKNPTSDYTVGQSLFTQGNRPFLIAGSYTDYAVVTPKQVMRIYPGGDYALEGPLGHLQYRQPLDMSLLQQVDEQLSRYYQQ